MWIRYTKVVKNNELHNIWQWFSRMPVKKNMSCVCCVEVPLLLMAAPAEVPPPMAAPAEVPPPMAAPADRGNLYRWPPPLRYLY